MYVSFHQFLILFVAVTCLASSAEAKDYKLYYLGGQSNMDGFGYVRDLSGDDAAPVKGVMMFHGNQGLDCQPEAGQGLWTELKPGNGAGFASDGTKNTYSDRFGVGSGCREKVMRALKQSRSSTKRISNV